MSNNKKVITISPAEVKEKLSQSEWEALLNVIDKLAGFDIELKITYSSLSNLAQ
jgi:hypothetical protein